MNRVASEGGKHGCRTLSGDPPKAVNHADSYGQGDLNISIADEILAALGGAQQHAGSIVGRLPSDRFTEHRAIGNDDEDDAGHESQDAPSADRRLYFATHNTRDALTYQKSSGNELSRASPTINGEVRQQDDTENSPLLIKIPTDASINTQGWSEVENSTSSLVSVRFFVISLVGLLIAMSLKVSDPVIAQYVYQVYTVQVYGNNSVKVPITKEPCVNTSGSNSSDADNDRLRDTVQDNSADLLLHLEMISNLTGVLSCLLLGTYSDVLGRRLSIFIPVTGLLLRDSLVPIIVHWDLGLTWLYAGNGVFGLTGGTSGLLLGCYVYTADITGTERQRTAGLALVMAGMGLGVALAQYSVGIFIQDTGFLFPSMTACFMDLSCILLVAVCLPETVPRDRKRWMTPWESVQHIVDTFTSRDIPHYRPLLWLQLLAFFMGVLADYPASKIDPLFLMDQPFCWSSSRIGLVGAIKNGTSRLTSILLLLPLQRILSAPNLAILGALSYLSANLLTGLAHSDLLVFLGAGAAMACSIMYSAGRAMMSRMVPPDRQGVLFGGIAVVESVCFALGELIFLSVYKAVVGFMPGIVYFAISGCFFINIVIFIIYQFLLKKTKLAFITASTVQVEETVQSAR